MKIAIYAAAVTIAGTGLAFAADMPLMAPPVARVTMWTGFYIGLNAGDTWDDNHSVDTLGRPIQGFLDGVGSGSFASYSAAAATGSTSFGNGNNGRFIGGGQIGYNWQFGHGLAGFEADIDGLSSHSRNITLNNTVGPFLFFGTGEAINSQIMNVRSLEYLGTVRGRLGFLAAPSFLFYVTGGGAYGGVRTSTAVTQANNDCVTFPGNCIAPTAASFGSASTARFGWTAGVGEEWMFASNWSAKVEYLYYDLGSISSNSVLSTGGGSFSAAAAIVNVQSTAKFNGSIARLGINYHFGAQVAKY